MNNPQGNRGGPRGQDHRPGTNMANPFKDLQMLLFPVKANTQAIIPEQVKKSKREKEGNRQESEEAAGHWFREVYK